MINLIKSMLLIVAVLAFGPASAHYLWVQTAETGEVTLQIHYKGSPIEGQEVTIYVSDLWSKKLHTDVNGEVSFMLPWATTYTIETTKKEEVPSTYKGEDYEFIWHCATYAIIL